MNKMPIIITVIILLCYSCHTEVTNESPIVHKGIVNINEKAESGVYTLYWGNHSISLMKYANPEVYKGSVKVSLSAFWDMLGMPIRLEQKDKSIEIELVGINRVPYQRSDSLRLSYPEFENQQLSSGDVTMFREGIEQGDVIELRVFSKFDEVKIQSAFIEIEDPNAPYVPEVFVYYQRQPEEPFSFQVIQEPGRRPVLRIDTSAEDTYKVYELYRENLLYKIIHIPGFKTHRRLLAGGEQLFKAKDIRKSVVLGKELIDWMALPEYTGEIRQSFLEWGEMLAQPSSKNYSISTFRQNVKQPLRLKMGEEELSIRAFRMIIQAKDHYPESYMADDPALPSLQKVLHLLEPATSIYFTQLIVEGKDGQCYLLPQDYAFHIGN